MANLEELVNKQRDRAALLQKCFNNLKKAPSERRTVELYEAKRKELDELWKSFNQQDNIIRQQHGDNMEHSYFVEDIHGAIGQLYNEAQEYIIKGISALRSIRELEAVDTQKPTPTPLRSTTELEAAGTQKPTPSNRQTIPNSALGSRVAKQRLLIETVESTLNRLLGGDTYRSENYYTAQLQSIGKHWATAQELHAAIFDSIGGIEDSEYDYAWYIQKEDEINESISRVKDIASQLTATTAAPSKGDVRSSIHLPNIEIPRFNGNYLNWRQYHDLYNELVHLQPIPDCQKLWYLKSSLSGEAAALIQHFCTSSANYEAAWKVVCDRYENKRLLVNAALSKLLTQPACTNEGASAVRTLHDTTQECLMNLENLGITTSHWDPLLLHLLVKKLDRQSHILYEQSLERPKEIQTISGLLQFLENRFQSLEALGGKDRSAATRAITSVATSVLCSYCSKAGHLLYHCREFLQLSVRNRLNWVKGQGLCFNCLKRDHALRDCLSRGCTKCNKKHNSLLHLEPKDQGCNKQTVQRNQSSMETKVTAPNASITVVATNNVAPRQGHVLLATARVRITASNGRSGEFRAILDSGSQINIVSERLIKKLAISPIRTSLSIEGIGRAQKRATQRVNVRLESLRNNFSTNLEAFVLPSIIPAQPNQDFNVSAWPIPSNIQLADPDFHTQGKIDVLLGAELYFHLMATGKITLPDDLPVLQNTTLGWIVSGKIGASHGAEPSNTLTCAVLGVNEEHNGSNALLEEVIERLWKMDEVDTIDKGLSPSEKQCESHFAHNVRKNEDGRFIVKFPFQENTSALGESRDMAYNRFIGLERRLLKNEELRNHYTQFLEEYEKLGHMTEVDADSLMSPNYFIPHHCVLKPDSTTTKLRVVFDASAKTSSGQSLNDLMYSGPTVQSELFSILLRFRLPRFVFTTDIEKMYRQILMHPDDQRYQLIMWRKEPTSNISYYKLNTVTYGTRAAPYLATKCLQRVGVENAINYPLGAQFLQDNFYVDDGLGGSDSLATVIETQRQLIHMLKKHGFNLRKWCANHPQLLKNIPHGDQEVNLDFNDNNNESIKTLGLLWLPKTDHFCVKVKLSPVKVATKRTVTSDLARLFDPLGLLAPVVVKAKMFIQQLWQLKLSWDEPLPANLNEIWAAFRLNLANLNDFQVPRHIFRGEVPRSTELHVFADASEKAFGAVAYIRATLRTGELIVRLLCAKTRVAPLKKQTLPRLELCAALLAAQLAARVRKDMQIKDQPTFLWTDSEIVLSWINAQSSSFNTFVANRVASIQTLSLPEQWRHVSSAQNPADLLSRGVTARTFAACTLWFQGPMFLHGKQDLWPPPFSTQRHLPTDLERKRAATISMVTTSSNDEIVYKIPHKNSFKYLQNTVAYVLRFIKNTRNPKEGRSPRISLTPQELDEALTTIVKEIQAVDFKEEIRQLTTKGPLSRSHSLNNLSPFLDNKSIMRVGGRLEASTLSYDAKHPMLLPHNDPLTKLMLIKIHEENLHCGPQALLAASRQRFWIIKGKSTARAVIQQCIQCNRARPQLYQQIMGNLPQTRVTPARPFINAGVDYCGPFWIHHKVRGKRATKAYIAVFCCFATKAVHLELTSDLTTEAFIGSLKRFISRRGRCQNIYSDNATNFVGAKNQLAELNETIYSDNARETIMSTCSNKGIAFHFIPPRAPHFGGLWEAAVKSAKHLLLRSVSTASLTYEEMETVIVEIEAILNSRPLIPMSSDPNDLTALTPGHFLIGEPITAQIDIEAVPIKASLLTRWKLVSHLRHEFWTRWSNEYLHELQRKTKWTTSKENIKPGDMVIIKEDNVPVMQWPLGRIVQVYKGGDGAARVADVKTAKGVFKRVIHRLAPLPVNTEEHHIPYEANEPRCSRTTTDETQIPSQDTKPIDCKLKRQGNSPAHSDNNTGKRHRTALYNPITMLAMLLILPIVLCSEIQVKKFDSAAGLHFDHIGSSQIIASEWNLVAYYDLKPLFTEIQFMINGTNAMQHLCQQLQQKHWCEDLVTQFQHANLELSLDNSLLALHRQKRGAINLVGNLANSLFGVLDADYANKMSQTITAIESNEQHLATLLKEQTSVIDSTINVIKRDQTSAQKTFARLDEKFTEVVNRIHEDERDAHNERLFQAFLSLALQLTITSANIQRIQSSIINVLINVHHGQISPQLLSPQQLNNEIAKITVHLPPTRQIPGYHGNMLSIYKLMTVKGGITKRHAIFKITVPLTGPDQFELYRLISIPSWVNNTMMAIKPATSLLAITLHRDKYFPMNTAILQSCTKLEEEEYLCPNSQPIYNKGAAMCSCEVSLFNNETSPTCEFVQMDDHMWIQTNQRNKWIFALATPIQVTAACNTRVSQIPLEGSGFLQLSPECVIKYNHLTLTGTQAVSSMLNASYTSFGKISELNNPNLPQPLSPTNLEGQYTTQLQELTSIQRILQSQNFTELTKEVRPHDIHHYTVSYTCVLILGCIVAWLIVKHVQERRRTVIQTPPQPKPRTLSLHQTEQSNIQPQQDLTEYV